MVILSVDKLNDEEKAFTNYIYINSKLEKEF